MTATAPLFDLLDRHRRGRSWNMIGEALGISGKQVLNNARGINKLPEYRIPLLADYLGIPEEDVRAAAGYPPLQSGDRLPEATVRGLRQGGPTTEDGGILDPERQLLRESAAAMREAIEAFAAAMSTAIETVEHVSRGEHDAPPE